LNGVARGLILVALVGVLAGGALAAPSTQPTSDAKIDPVVNAATETAVLSKQFADGGLAPVVGVQNIEVFRASRGAPDLTDGKGWTYNHHVDMACWRGKLFIAWDNGEKDEDVWPAREVYSTSEDGFTWSKPAELFPQGASTSLRMYFFLAPSGRMLAIAGLRINHNKLVEAEKPGAVVREIRADHTLGPVFTLVNFSKATDIPPAYMQSSDAGFVTACEQLLSNKLFLEQQDNGALLGPARMSWHDKLGGDFGKAFCFFRRPDGTLVGIGKKAWTVVSTDNGATWSQPVKLQSFNGGNAKEWIQRTTDGHYAWLHDPFEKERYPLVALTSVDGTTFADMRVVHGEVPPQRYQGQSKNIGPQYVRGISIWANDGSRNDSAMWVGYSVNKEDIWVSRIPVPIRNDVTGPVADEFTNDAVGSLVPGWNTYSPLWGGVSIVAGSDGNHLQLEDRDPYDYARADRVFGEASQVTAQFKVMVDATGAGQLQIELWSPTGDVRPVRIVLTPDGVIGTMSSGAEAAEIGRYKIGQWVTMKIEADTKSRKYSVMIEGKPAATDLDFAENVNALARLVFRTGNYRRPAPISAQTRWIDPATDKPTAPARFRVGDVHID
jgi:hypothetical protein